MENAGLVDACVAAAAVAVAAVVVFRFAWHWLVGDGWRRLLAVPSGMRAKRVALAVALAVHAAVLLSAIYSSVTTSKDLAFYLEKTEAKLTQMEQIIQNQEKRNDEMMSNLISMLSKNPGNINWMTYKVNNPDGRERAELAVSMKDHVQPPRDEIMDLEVLERSEHAAPVPETSPHPQDEATKAHKPWRFFSIPEDHAFVLDCVGDEVTVHIRPPSSSFEQRVTVNDQLPCTCGQPEEEGTLSLYDSCSYRALFWPLPGKEGVVPVAWPRQEMWERMTAAVLGGSWETDPPSVDEKTAPESFALSPDVVVFYRPVEGRADVLIASREEVEHLQITDERSHGRTPFSQRLLQLSLVGGLSDFTAERYIQLSLCNTK